MFSYIIFWFASYSISGLNTYTENTGRLFLVPIKIKFVDLKEKVYISNKVKTLFFLPNFTLLFVLFTRLALSLKITYTAYYF